MYIIKCDNCGEEEEISSEEGDLMIKQDGMLCENSENKIFISEPDDIYEKRKKYASKLQRKKMYGEECEDEEECREFYVATRTEAFNFCCLACLIEFSKSGKLDNLFDDWKEYTDKEEEEEEERNLKK